LWLVRVLRVSGLSHVTAIGLPLLKQFCQLVLKPNLPIFKVKVGWLSPCAGSAAR